MSERINGKFFTVTVIASSSVGEANGSTGIALQTLEGGTIVFRVDQQAIDALRRDLLACEALLNSKTGSA